MVLRSKRAIAPRALSHSCCRIAVGIVRGDVGVHPLKDLSLVVGLREDRLGNDLAGQRRNPAAQFVR